jgi:hypothetical protein
VELDSICLRQLADPLQNDKKNDNFLTKQEAKLLIISFLDSRLRGDEKGKSLASII